MENSDQFKNRMELYIGGKKGDKIKYGKPVINEDGNQKFLYPNEARLRNMTYAITVHVDIEALSNAIITRMMGRWIWSSHICIITKFQITILGAFLSW